MTQNTLGQQTVETEPTMGDESSLGGGQQPPDVKIIWGKVQDSIHRIDKQENLMWAVVLVLLVMVAGIIIDTVRFHIDESNKQSPQVIVIPVH